jgi:hypothetical protein
MESPRQAGGSGAGAAKHDSIRADACSSIFFANVRRATLRDFIWRLCELLHIQPLRL